MRRATKTVHLLIGLGLCAIACAAVAAEEIDTATATRDSARIVIANRTVIVVRGPIAGYSATERATASTNRIIDVLEANPSPAIKLDDQHGSVTDKICNVRTNRRLPAKACAVQAMRAQYIPNALLGVR